MNFYATFSIPFIVGVVPMFVVLIVKYGSWIFGLSAADRMRIVKGIPVRGRRHWRSGEVVRESLLHRRIFKVNPFAGLYAHEPGLRWFLLIVVGWIETVAYLGSGTFRCMGMSFSNISPRNCRTISRSSIS